MTSQAPVLRFAPSPNGYLHLGHALSALEVDRWARALGGRFLLRIEDTDLSRSRPAFVEAIFEDLRWLGLYWEEPVRHQSEHLGTYGAALQSLWDQGLIYPAPASRSDIQREVARREASGQPWPRDPDGGVHYPFGARDRQSRPAAMPTEGPLRLDLAAALERLGEPKLTASTLDDPGAEPKPVPVDPGLWGDVLLRGRDRPATYHLAVVIDDDLQGITHVVRGIDMEPATAIHRLLQALLGLRAPLYHHHRLILGDDGRKLSKSEGAKSLRALRQRGTRPDAVRAAIGWPTPRSP
ncbi:MAG: tRNA glutamyl-Q(34) synthetase GluQRS [Devosiaceae bacterium]|nr:tRNA glutamyl-Q(34) synthetase GluQRS [Devosiaceae bacterium MH13]